MPRWRILHLAFILLALPLPAVGLDRVDVILSEEGGAYAEVADKMRAVLAQGSAARMEVRVMTPQALRLDGGAQMLVAVGTAAMEMLAQKNPAQPVLSVLVPRAAFDRAVRQGGLAADARRFSAITLDQPWARQFALIRHAVPGRTKVGILLGPDSGEAAAALRAAAKVSGMTVAIETVSGEADLQPALKRLLGASEVLLAVPDSVVYNRYTIQSILLAAYRQQVPLFGFSPSYVKAGALAAVYSVPAQIGQQAAEAVLRQATERQLPPPQPPRYFSVGINSQVAHSLGIRLEDEASLLNKLRQSPEAEP
jgi:hypothetical protein